MAKKSGKREDRQAEEVKKLRKEIKTLREQNEATAKSLKKLRKDYEESRKELANLLKEPDGAKNLQKETPNLLPNRAQSKTGEASMISTWITGASKGANASGPAEEPEVTSAARRKAEKLGVEPSEVAGSGVEGRVTLKDVEKAAGEV